MKNNKTEKNKSSRSRTILLLLFVLPGIVGLYLLFMTFNGPPPKPILPYYGIVPMSTDTLSLPNFNFTNQLGQSITKDSLQNKIKIVHFFNTKCTDTCIEVVNNLVEVQDYFKVGEDVHILSFTTDVEHDQPPVLQAFGKQYETNNRQWTFLTATNPVEISNFQQYNKHPFFNVEEPEADNLNTHHKLILIDKAGKIRGYYNGMREDQTVRLREHIEVLKLAYGTQEKYR